MSTWDYASNPCLVRHPITGEWCEAFLERHNEESLRSMVRFADDQRGWVNDEHVEFEERQKRLI